MRLKVENIKKFCDQYFEYDIGIKSRVPRIAETRYYYYYFCKSFLVGETTVKIGATCGYKDHSSVIHGLKRFNILYEVDANFKKGYDTFEHKAIEHFKIDFTDSPDAVTEQLKEIYRLKKEVKYYKTKLYTDKLKLRNEIQRIKQQVLV